MKNKELIKKKLNNLPIGYSLGCYNYEIEKLSKMELSKVLFKLEEDWTDVEVLIGSKEYIVEISTVDNEKDLDIFSKEEYVNRYKKQI